MIVHFPVALLIMGGLLEGYGAINKDIATRTAGRFNTRLGFWMALVTAVVGLAGLSSLQVDPKFQNFLSSHIRFGLSTLLVFSVALLFHRFAKFRGAGGIYMLLLVAGVCCVLATGYFGGELVHRFGISTAHPLE